MKIIVGVILSLALLQLFHCIPLYEDGRGDYSEQHTSYVEGQKGTNRFNPGLEIGLKDEAAVLKSTNTLGSDGKSYKDFDVKIFDRPADATPPQRTTFGAPNDSWNPPIYAAPTFPVFYPQAPTHDQMNGPVPPYGLPYTPIYAAPTGPVYYPWEHLNNPKYFIANDDVPIFKRPNIIMPKHFNVYY